MSQAPPSRWSGGVISGMIGTIALAVWKFKFIAVALLTKGKLLLLGLTKASTFFTMFASMGLYWTVFGGWPAVGLVLSIYVHEMGHVFALMRTASRRVPRFSSPAWAPLSSSSSPSSTPSKTRGRPRRPDLGTATALLAGVYALTSVPIWAAIAQLARLSTSSISSRLQLDGARLPQPEPRPAPAGRRLGRHRLALTDQNLLILLLAAARGTPSPTNPPKTPTPPSSPSMRSG